MVMTLSVEGMSCEHCEQTVVEALRGVRGVTEALVDRETGRARVEGHADVDALLSAVERAGYTARV